MICLRKLLTTALLAVVTLAPLIARASAPPQAQAVLGVEQRWLVAIAKHDAKALGAILAENFVHVDYRGTLSYREDALADVGKAKPYVQKTDEQSVDLFGNSAIVHGVNAIWQGGKVVLRLRYTDVYQHLNGRWLAVSAQETQIAKP